MPNHVKNVLKIKTHDVEDLMNRITSPNDAMKDPWFPIDYIIDFDKIIPEPRKPEDCSPDCIIPEAKRKRPGIEITDDRDWFDWYRWRLENWGTKWGAYDCYCIIKKSYVAFVFSTAWNIPDKIYKKLADMGYEMEIRYADEDLGSNCGMLYYNNETKEWTQEDPVDTRRWARRLWAKY